MRIHRVALSLPFALLLSAPAIHAQATVPGWTYAINITTDSGTGAPDRGSMAMRYQTTATAMRMEIMQLGGAANRITHGVDIEGVYTLINDADSTMATVLPSQHAATIMPNPTAMLGDRAKPTVDVKSTTKSTEDLGPGDKILGHATHHYRMTSSGTVTFKIGDEICTRSTDGETELWIAPDVDIAPAMRSMAAHYGMSVPEAAAQPSSALPKGLPLRTKTRQTAVLPTGESRVIETTMEYVELSSAPLDASLFAIPADYRVMDMRKMPGILARAAEAAAAKPAPHLGVCPQ